MTVDATLNSYSSNDTIDIQELAIALFAQQLNPQISQLEFLKFSGIIPTDWKLAGDPVATETRTQLAFENGLNLLAQPRTVNFFEAIDTKELQELQVPIVVRRYIEKLPNADYQALSINPKMLVAFPDRQAAARNFMLKTLLSPGSWQDFGRGLVQASVSLVYQLDRCQLSLTINEVRLQQGDRGLMPALLFSGSFNYDATGETSQERQSHLTELLDNWQADFDTFRELVRKQFLGTEKSIFPPEMI